MDNVYKTMKTEVKDGVALLIMTNPPANQLSTESSEELMDAFTHAFDDPAVKAVIFTGSGKNFVTGPDVTQMNLAKVKEDILPSALAFVRFLNNLEQAPKAVIAAINGDALGAGLELALASHYRIAVKGSRLGLPEVHHGAFPRFGGVERLPRLVGLPNALELITNGSTISSEQGYNMSLIDELVLPEQLIDNAKAMAHKFVSGEIFLESRRTRNLTYRLPSALEKKAIVNSVRAVTAKKTKGFTAPLKVIEAVEKGLTFDIEKDIDRDTEMSCELGVSEVAKNLMTILVNARSAGKLPRTEGVVPKEIRKVGVLGGGVMGSGIIHVLLRDGFDVIFWDVNQDAIDKGLSRIRKTFASKIKKNKMTTPFLDQLLQDHLTITPDLDGMKNGDLVIEAVIEDMKIKQDLLKALERICRPDSVFATNTSSLPVTTMASVLSDPSRLIGLHFFNPVERMELIEIICGKKTSDATLSTGIAFTRAIKKVPVTVNDGPGFYVTRQLAALCDEMNFIVAEGVSPLAIETATFDFGLPMGVFSLSDLTGIDINYHVIKTLEGSLGERWAMPALEELVYRTGCYGRKTGAGWFDYKSPKPVLNPLVMKVVEEYWKEKGIAPKEMSARNIIDRMFAKAINEAAYMIEEGICERPEEMDLALIYGTGFPRYRGGILRYADSWGVTNIYTQLVKLEKEQGIRFRPAALLKEMAQSGKTFYRY